MTTIEPTVKPVLEPAAKPTRKAPADVKVAVAAENKLAAQSTLADEVVTTKKKKDATVRAFTYVGAGDSSPYVITLMGKQKFVRGELTEVTDPDILAKIEGLPTFIEGEANAQMLHKIDQEGKEAMEAQRAQDIVINARYIKKHVGE